MGETKTAKDKKSIVANTKKKPAMKDILSAKKTGGKKKKNKWSKTKSKEKLNMSVIWTKASWEKCSRDLIAKENYVTPHVISEKCKVNVSLARAAIKQLVEEGKLTAYNGEEGSYGLFVKSDNFRKELEAKPAAAATDNKKEKKGGKK